MDAILTPLPWIGFIFIIIWILLSYVIPHVKKSRRKNQQLDEIDEKYESLRKLRKDLIYHIDWARERGEHKRARELEGEIERIEKELEELRARYNEVQNQRSDLNKIH
jgi:archaellum component FlaC